MIWGLLTVEFGDPPAAGSRESFEGWWRELEELTAQGLLPSQLDQVRDWSSPRLLLLANTLGMGYLRRQAASAGIALKLSFEELSDDDFDDAAERLRLQHPGARR